MPADPRLGRPRRASWGLHRLHGQCQQRAHLSAGTDFLALMSLAEATQQFAEAGLTPLTVDPFKGVKADPNTVSLATLLSSAPVTVTPADNLDVKRADEFYGAAAAVIGGLKSPQEALDAAQAGSRRSRN